MINETAEIESEAPTQQVAPNNDLLPCPFCGNAPVRDRDFDLDLDFIRCDCGAAHWGEDVDWNKRAR